MLDVAGYLKGRSFTKMADWSRSELETVLDLAGELKLDRHRRLLPGRTVGLIFHKPSTRTRVSFGVGISQLGGVGFFLTAEELQLGRSETIRDTALVLSRYLDAIAIRTFAQADVEQLAEHATIPVINALTDEAHPMQRRPDLAGYGIDAELVRAAGEQALVLHCLPAHYGEEITEEVVYGPQSAVFDEAENRLHTQKALLALIVS